MTTNLSSLGGRPLYSAVALPDTLGGLDKAKAINKIKGQSLCFEHVLDLIAGKQFTMKLITSSEELEQLILLRTRLFRGNHDAATHEKLLEHDHDTEHNPHNHQSPSLNPVTDRDQFDDYALHMVIASKDNPSKTIAYVRLILEEDACANNGFYSHTEFNLDPIIQKEWRIMELGRLFVVDEEQHSHVVKLLFQGVMAVAAVMQRRAFIGCGSFFGNDISQHRRGLSWLVHRFTIDHQLMSVPQVRPEHAFDFEPLPWDEVKNLSMREASIPSILGFYLLNGALIGRGIALDSVIKTLDVLVVMSFANLRRSIDFYSAIVAQHLVKLDTENAPVLKAGKPREITENNM